jgi:hypothetical protein
VLSVTERAGMLTPVEVRLCNIYQLKVMTDRWHPESP